MKNEMLNLIKLAIEDESKFKSLENIYALYDQLQYSENLNEMASSLYDWLYEKYEVNNMSFSLFDMEKNTTTEILKKGGEFFLDGEYSFYFIINTHTELNAVVSFAASNQKHYDIISSDYSYIEAAFFQISPILQNGIMKKHHIEASSIDSVTNVHNRKYLIKHINKMISLSGTNDGMEQKMDWRERISVDPLVCHGKACIKGIYEHELFESKGRGKHPLVRTSIHDDYQRVSWDKALGDMAGKIRDIQDKYGRDSFAIVSTGQLMTEEFF